mgnify:CR=1 FL=1
MKVPKQTFSTFTKEGISRKYYTSFCIHLQPSLDQNEVFADLEIITDQNEIEKIWEESNLYIK